MAKVKITGHASGSGVLTITAPNTSTDRTITLPDATGTLLNSDGSGANLTSLPADATKLPLAGGALTGDVTLTTGSSPKIKVEETGGSYIEMEAGGSTGHIKSKSGHDITFSPGGTNHLQLYSSGRAKSQFTAHAWGKISCQGTPGLLTGHNVSSITDQATGRYRCNYTTNSGGANTVVISGQNNNYYDEIYHLDVDESNSSKAAFGCTRVNTGASWFDTYKMSFVTFALTS